MREQTPRERVIRAIQFEGPDRSPIHRYIMPGAFHRYGQKLVDLLNKSPDDFGVGRIEVPPETANNKEVVYRDEWGCLWKHLKGVGYSMGEVMEPALPTWDRFKDYQFPPLPSFKDLEQHIRTTNHKWYAFGYGPSLFERMQWIRGPTNLYMDLAENNEEVNELAGRLVDYYIEGIKRSLEAGADGCYCGDDWGAQHSLLISPKRWREFFKPRYKRMFDVVKNGGGHVWFHTDGYTWDILDDFIEIGVDVLNPQHHIMGDERVAKRIAGRVCLRSDLDRQYILPYGTKEEVESHVKEIIALFGNFDGGLILHGEIGPDVPFENIQTMYWAFEKYGTYPLYWLGKHNRQKG